MKKRVIRTALTTTRLHLIALAAMLLAGATSATAQNYPPVRTDIQLDETLLPIVFIKTLGQEINRDEHISAEMTIIWNDGGLNYSDTLAHPGQHIDYRGHIGIRYRGNSSFSYSAKKPYSIKLLTDSYEAGRQNWTPRMTEAFRQRHGIRTSGSSIFPSVNVFTCALCSIVRLNFFIRLF